MKSGFVTLLGRPNAGKSTILNALIGRKIAIVTPKPQTTTDAIQGIYTDERGQIVFVDTPGIHKPHVQYGTLLNTKSYKAIRSGDLSILVIDASLDFGPGDEYITEHIKFNQQVIIVLNKIDLASPQNIEILKQKYSELYKDAPIIEVSAIKSFNLDELKNTIFSLLDEGPMYYDPETSSNYKIDFLIAEIIREKAIMLTRQEVPHSIAVIIEKIDEKETKIEAYASIVVEKESQKGILIGAGAKMIRRIRLQSQFELSKLLEKDVLLELLVKVEPNWRDNSKLLAKLGLERRI